MNIVEVDSKAGPVSLTSHGALAQTTQHIHVGFSSPYQLLSSAVLNGGLQVAHHVLNLKVDASEPSSESPQQSLQQYSHQKNWHGTVVGMMTAASMNSCRVFRTSVEGVDMSVALTLGLSNAGRVGEPCGSTELSIQPDIGTINIIFVTSANLTSSAMVEAVQMITEAKAAALQDANIQSQYSSGIATGTGTDAVVVASFPKGKTLSYCGKHVLFGELLGKLVYQAMLSSLRWYHPGNNGHHN